MKNLITAVIMMLTFSSNAESGITLGEAGYGGSGCPAGSASVTLSPDQTSLSIIFDEFFVEAGSFTGRRIARKSCNLAIPVQVPQGYSVSIIDADYRGYVSLPNRSSTARFTAEYFFAGQRGPRYSTTFRGNMEEDYLIEDQIGVSALVWSKCGADVNLRVNSSMTVRASSTRVDALATVDSADFDAGLVYHVQWRRCNQ